MKSIRVRFSGPTNNKGARFTASTGEPGQRVTVPYDHGSNNPQRAAVNALLAKLGQPWTGWNYTEGSYGGDWYYTPIVDYHTL